MSMYVSYDNELATTIYEKPVIKTYQLMEASMVVMEVFVSLINNEKLDDDLVYGESETDAYNTLIGIVLEIERQNTEDNPIYIEDIRDKAKERILEEYGKKQTYQVSRSYFKTVEVKAKSEEEAIKIASECDLFANVSFEPGHTEVV